MQPKTFKREIAAFAQMVWASWATWLFFGVDPQALEAYRWLFESVTGVIWLFAGAAFGLDAWAKQVRR